MTNEQKKKTVSKTVWFDTQVETMDSIHTTRENPKFNIEYIE
jgi:hypothetical protein